MIMMVSIMIMNIIIILKCFVMIINVMLTIDHLLPGSLKVKCTTKSDRCCRLGRKAARHHLISPFYTCHYEALIAGLDHQKSVANRMRIGYQGRLKHTKTIVRTTAFRSRLGSCFLPRSRKCFESCCTAKRQAMIKASKQRAKKIASTHVTPTPATKYVRSVVTTPKHGK